MREAGKYCFQLGLRMKDLIFVTLVPILWPLSVWPLRLSARTRDSHSRERGSTPLGANIFCWQPCGSLWLT